MDDEEGKKDWQRVGRRWPTGPKSKTAREFKRILINVVADRLPAIDQCAQDEGKSRSDWIRDLIDAALVLRGKRPKD